MTENNYNWGTLLDNYYQWAVHRCPSSVWSNTIVTAIVYFQSNWWSQEGWQNVGCWLAVGSVKVAERVKNLRLSCGQKSDKLDMSSASVEIDRKFGPMAHIRIQISNSGSKPRCLPMTSPIRLSQNPHFRFEIMSLYVLRLILICQCMSRVFSCCRNRNSTLLIFFLDIFASLISLLPWYFFPCYFCICTDSYGLSVTR